jgi:hypothetical protein
MKTMVNQVNAVIGVWNKNGKTFYVKRSDYMKNYPNVWGLLSIQFNTGEFNDLYDLNFAQALMTKMSNDRLGGVPTRVLRYITSAQSADNPYNTTISVNLYEIELLETPKLNPLFYVDSAWFTPEEFFKITENSIRGLCTKTWHQYLENQKNKILIGV